VEDQLKIEENGDNSHQGKDKAKKWGLLPFHSIARFRQNGISGTDDASLPVRSEIW